ncbi:MAG: aminomethyl-transferring glycine dehydrogenase subunit GcvPB [Chloroflexi bacterium]|nr:aminomethyl-transferring glycine dehydrogenase subunit GcvPB [Chloroflexota bacterium]MCI0788830.1 aminomethyl-transferring glycine dehydrogenase subunit GcvPB [Chloroflexota bacterium]MCI0801793.1 aminomethyl-transferring glycine dehydrogenase subunit GcvPB [Chloroflexota bacterium]MCI0829860.1 aminomethyl-transferring glycine dehydrogenase subunit GcvPB [Chloroflexota bacterium]MCI0848220.1 aminomethyl-transferring glycine dehydrogenase subunit GcvPB [Chloroflexota bacterium]
MRQGGNRQTEKLLMERSVPGRVGVVLPEVDVPAQPLPANALLRDELPLPEVSEPEVVQYFTGLSQLNFSIDTHFYPLGSCTMKYNPKVNDEISFLPGFAGIHPMQPAEQSQGALELVHKLQGFLGEITGLPAVSLATLAGAHGELGGMLMIRAYHLANGDTGRTKVAIPDSAHGTNPASAAMAGFQVVELASDKDGNVDLEALHEVAGPDLAGVMITLPSTLGLFDTNIVEVCRIVHEAGGLVYGDGANMNALMGRVKLGELGFDVAHLNLHKTFSTPHGGGGPGAGPVCATPQLAPYLAGPVVTQTNDAYEFATPEKSIGKLSGFHGNFGVLVRAYTYIRTLGGAGIKSISGNAVLNANYMMNGLRGVYHLPYDRTCMHEAVFSADWQKERGSSGLEIAKRLLDYGFHAPTMYFPLIVHEALMIEPTESETKETIDAFIQALIDIDREVTENPELVNSAPHTTPVARLDEAKAARQPDLRWQPEAAD